MNKPWNKLKSAFMRKRGSKSFIISVVILFEVIALLVVATYAWVETVSSIKIATDNNNELEVDTYVFTEAMIGEGRGTIDLAKYFKQSGDMHFAPASSTDGRTLFFPKVTSAGTAYVSSGTGRFRKSSTSDMNTTYLSITFKLKADANADFFFVQEPTFSEQSANMRVSITSQTMGSTDSPVTTIYKMADTSQETCVNTVDGGTSQVTVEKIGDHIKGKSSDKRLFAVGAEETKIVTINVWLSGTTLDSSLPEDISISNFGITSNLTPRRVTLIPTSRWDTGGQTFYAWCWAAPGNNKSRLYKLSLDGETEHYCFDYNGSYTKTTFVRAVSGCTVEEGEYDSWPFSNSTSANSDGYFKQTVDTSIPTEPLDPTFAIDTYNGGTDSKSTGVWASPDLVTYKLAYANGQNSSCGTLSATTYIGTTTSTNVMEATNTSNSNSKHHNTVHALPGKKVKLTATAKANYAFVGWYSNAECTGSPLSSNELNASTTAPIEITYYAKFKEVRTLTIVKYLDGVETDSTTATGVGTITIGGTTSGADVASYYKTVDKGTTVSFSAAASPGYTLEGIYTTATGSNSAGSSVKLDENETYYARYTTNLSTVTIYMAPREDWGEPDLHIWDSKGVISDHLTASYDGNTGYYTATVQTRGKWLKAILSKDSNYTGQTSDITVVSSISAGANYNKFIDKSNNVSDWSSTKRCIWFIITETWLENDLKNNGDYMQVYENNADTDMRRINDTAYVVELSNPSGTIYFKQKKSDNSNRNQWETTVPTGSKSQFKEKTYESGDWQ